MNISGAYRVHGPQAMQGPHYPRPTTPSQSSSTPQGADRVDISAAASEAAGASEATDIRSDLVARVRSEIAAGTYETPQRIDAALERLLDQMG